MKHLLCILALCSVVFASAQNQATQTSNWFLEANAPFGGGWMSATGNAANTGFSFFTMDGDTYWSVGLEGGYFVVDNLALKAGAGYNDFDGYSVFTYKAGAKYYIGGLAPIQVDVTGGLWEDNDGSQPAWLGLQGGFAIFLTDNISIEPSIRYNVSLNDSFTDDNHLEAGAGFVLFFGGRKTE